MKRMAKLSVCACLAASLFLPVAASACTYQCVQGVCQNMGYFTAHTCAYRPNGSCFYIVDDCSAGAAPADYVAAAPQLLEVGSWALDRTDSPAAAPVCSAAAPAATN